VTNTDQAIVIDGSQGGGAARARPRPSAGLAGATAL